MNRSLLNSVAVVALALGSSALACAQETQNTPKRFLVKTQTYGDMMGSMSADVDSKCVYMFYNTDGNTVAKANYGRTYVEQGGNGDFEITNITKYKFDANGRPTNLDSFQWGQYDQDDYGWKKTYNCESYVYNDAGQLVSDTTSNYIHVYEYNAEGLLAKTSTYYKSSKGLSSEITYSYDNGRLVHYSSTGKYDSYVYDADIEYDEAGNKVEEYHYSNASGKNVSKQIERWTYTDGVLSLYEKFTYDSDGKEVPSSKTEYTLVDGNPNVVDVRAYDYFSGVWTPSGLRQRYTYVDFTDMEQATAMEILSTELDDKLDNTVNLKFSVPEMAMAQSCKFVIYRDCMPVDTVDLADVYNPEANECVYQDKGLKNGTYYYFIQPLFGSFGMDLLDAEGGEDSQTEWIGYYSTMPVYVDVTLKQELPAVTDLAFVSGEVKTTGNITNLTKEYYANLAWKNPADMDKFGFKKNSVFVVGSGVPELDVTDAKKEGAQVQVYDDETQLYVVTSYQYGKAFSETITVKMKDIETGVDKVTVNGAVKATFAANTVTFDEAANVSVFSASGEKVCAENNTTSVALNGLPTATYIICVEKGGNLNVYKYAVK